MTHGYDVGPPHEQPALSHSTSRPHLSHQRDLVAEIAAEVADLATVTQQDARRGWELLAPFLSWVGDPEQAAAEVIAHTLDEIVHLVVQGINHVLYRVTRRSTPNSAPRR